MNVYLDLEATQFSREIISIGAVNEKGDTFFTLVRPRDLKKITKLITKITGLTIEDFDDESIGDISWASRNFYSWLKSFCGDLNKINMFVFGTFDITLIKSEYNRYSLKELKYVESRIRDLSMVSSKLVFGNRQGMGLFKTMEYLTGETYIQTHHPIEDAQMLMALHNIIKKAEVDVLRVIEEEYYVNRYIKKYRNKKLKHYTLKRFFNSLTDLELENLEYKEIGNIIGFSHVEQAIRDDFYDLYGVTAKYTKCYS